MVAKQLAAANSSNLICSNIRNNIIYNWMSVVLLFCCMGPAKGNSLLQSELNSLKDQLEKELAEITAQNQELTARIAKIRAQLEAIEHLLPASGGNSPPIPAGDKHPGIDHRVFTPTHVYWPVILQALDEAGGSARGEEIIERVGAKLMNILTPADREMLPSGVIRWRNRVAWQRFNMVQQGLLNKQSRRGVWEITDEGRRQLSQFRDRLRNLATVDASQKDVP